MGTFQLAVTISGPHQVTRSLPGGLARNDVELTEYRPNRRITLESRDGPTPFRYRYDFEPSHGGTAVRLEGHIRSAGLPGPFAHLDGMATQLFKHGMRRNLDQLKGVLEH